MIWIQAIRPKTLIASLSPVVIGSSIAVSAGNFRFWIFCATLLTALGIQIVTNLANDYFDFNKGADTEGRLGPTRVMQAGLVTTSSMKWGLMLATFATALCGTLLIYRGGIPFLVLITCALLLAYLYTAGPFPLAYLGLGDLFVIVFFGPVATACVVFLQLKACDLPSFVMGLCPGALSTVMLTCNNLRDVEEDRRANKRTLVVRLGMTFGKIEVITCLALTLLVPFFFVSTLPYLSLISLGMAWPTFRFTRHLLTIDERSEYNTLLEQGAKLLLLFTILYVICRAISPSTHIR